ncbi:PREDICTED: delta-9 acyl-lipid desaturase 1-like [Tarenaya hassleriana]|uniref:delta-9 acyl-lipid desaturase 1-like n=1 Tax=Tarenaya hassleriana TaxID=28532 RepID=UPI00053C32F4|nr:PREDICTED: delta-9 acyl-lipid desaturase 1-like [Tarenaya hassleriana]XP_019056625.1 PREDICTED: delta-9 acyl-lipid desaturase 1-like [Tarenaya hassleriana]
MVGTSEKPERMMSERRAFWGRKWKRLDVVKASMFLFVHFLCLLAPFHFNRRALRLALAVYTVGGLGITVSYHRNLAHRSYKLPKWLEYFFAYCGLLALQGDPIDWVSIHRYHHQFTDSDRDPHSPIEGFWFSHILWLFDAAYVVQKCGRRSNVEDLKRQWFYRFLQRTVIFHILGFGVLLYSWGGFPFLAWGMGIGIVLEHHVTCLINSLCHVWGNRAWKTNDTSRNVWWLSVFSFGESWHNNHHAFESSARQGLEWWQVDISWYIIRFLETVGLATDVKLPSQAQLRRMALVR